ncbi:hypothetical protein ACXR2T_12135, partial [Leucobacter sp. HY1910]
QPIAKRLAEEYAEVSLDERHAAARKRRRIEVVDREDGMAELYAYLAGRDRVRDQRPGAAHRETNLDRRSRHGRG